jgi:hypothetical protein
VIVHIPRLLAGDLLAPTFTLRDTIQPLMTHQPRHTIMAARLASITQLLPNPRTAHHPIATIMDSLDMPKQTPVILRPMTQRYHNVNEAEFRTTFKKTDNSF